MSASTKAFLCSMLPVLVVVTLPFMMSVFRFQSTLTDLVLGRLTVAGYSISRGIPHSEVAGSLSC